MLGATVGQAPLSLIINGHGWRGQPDNRNSDLLLPTGKQVAKLQLSKWEEVDDRPGLNMVD